MNIITWNVMGLGKPAKWFLEKDFLNMHFADICCLQESKLEEISDSTWREIGGYRLDKFSFIPAHGSGRGTVIGWNSALMTGTLVGRGNFSLLIEFYSRILNLTWRCTSVYGPNARSLKFAF